MCILVCLFKGSPFEGDWEELFVSGVMVWRRGTFSSVGDLGLSQCGEGGRLAVSLCLAGGGRFCGGCMWCVSPQEGRRGHGALRRGDMCLDVCWGVWRKVMELV